MRKYCGKNIQLNRLKIKNIYKVSNINIMDDIISRNAGEINVLNEEVKRLLNNKWIYMKNKKVYYNPEMVSLFPDLLTFVIGFCPIRESFNDSSIRLDFSEYRGRIMTYQELLKILDDDGCVQGICFYNYTIFLNGIRYIDKDYKENINTFNDGGNPYLSYHIPIYELGKNRTIIDKNGYDLKYVDEGRKIKSLSDTINLWFEYELIPKGLSRESENLYIKLMELSKRKLNSYTVNYKKINNIYKLKRRKSNE